MNILMAKLHRNSGYTRGAIAFYKECLRSVFYLYFPNISLHVNTVTISHFLLYIPIQHILHMYICYNLCRQCPYVLEAVIGLAELGVASKDIISSFTQVSPSTTFLSPLAYIFHHSPFLSMCFASVSSHFAITFTSVKFIQHM